MPAGSPLTQACRIAADSSPPDRRWLEPARSALTHARRPPLSLAPWIKSTCHGQECRVSVLLCPQEHFNLPCLVMSCPWRLVWGSAPFSLKWRRSLRDPVRAPDSWSCPEEASASELALEGFLFLWAVLSCLSGPGGLSCLVLYCPVCLAPEGSWYPLTSPGMFFGGVVRVLAVGAGPRGPRPRPQGPPAMASWAPCTAMASWAPSYAMASWAPCTAMASWAPSSAMASFVCLFRSGGPRPVFLSMSVLRGLQSAHPPSPVELLRRGTRLPGGGSYVRVLSCVSCVPASCVHIWFVSCPRQMSLWVNSCPAVYVLVCVFLFLPRVCTVTKIMLTCIYFMDWYHSLSL